MPLRGHQAHKRGEAEPVQPQRQAERHDDGRRNLGEAKKLAQGRLRVCATRAMLGPSAGLPL